MTRSSRTLALSFVLLAATCAPAFADSPGGTNPVPTPPKSSTTTTDGSTVVQILISLLGL